MKLKTLILLPLRMRLPLTCAGTLLMLVLQGCATLDRDECRVADWRLIGYQDGVQGKPAGIIGTYREDCAKHGVVPDLDDWQAGRAQGLREYCTASTAFRLGRAGSAYPAVCPEAERADLQPAYDEGRAIYLARSQVKDTRAQIERRGHQIDHLQDDKRHKLTELVQDGVTKERRVLLLYEIHEIDEQIGSLSVELDDLEHDLHVQQAYLDSLVSSSAP
ncbi:MAG: DUF2799 domain-containing protein [Pseudomonadota bacterium]